MPTTMGNKHKGSEKEACTKRRYDITEADLPLSCPPSNMRVWDAHPRVYFPIESTGHYMCPYCGAEYVLQGAVDKSVALQDHDAHG